MALPSTLPSVLGLGSLSRDELLRLSARLRAVGLTSERVQRVNAIGRAPLDAMRMPIIRWHLRRETDPSAHAMRLFLYHDALSDDEARALLGDALALDRALESGLLARDEGGVRSAWCLAMVNDVYVLYDSPKAGGDAVMGLAPTSGALCSACYPEEPVGSVLEVGCGAGAASLLCASRAERVVGVDINPRAVEIAKINAALNGIENVEFRVGDLFAPVAGETFDLVVSQPPFLAHPPGDVAATTLHGGERGDELPLRLLRELPRHLAPGGRAILLVEWPVVEGDPIDQRIRKALPQPDINLLELETTGGSLDEHCSGYAATETGSIGPEYEKRFAERRSHLDAMGIRDLRLSFTVVARSPRSPGWTSMVEIRPLQELELQRRQIDKMIAGRDLLGAGLDALLAAKLRIPEGTRIAEDDGRIVATLPAHALVPPVRTTRGVMELVLAVQGAECPRDAILALATAHGQSFQELVDDATPAIRNALLYGLLEPA